MDVDHLNGVLENSLVISMRESLWKESVLAKALTWLQTALVTMESGLLMCYMVAAFICGRLVTSMMVNGSSTRLMVEAHTSIHQVTDTKVSGLKASRMVVAHGCGLKVSLLATATKVKLWTVSRRAKVLTIGRVVTIMMVNGVGLSSMDKVACNGPQAN